jgi:HEAT repeat protein
MESLRAVIGALMGLTLLTLAGVSWPAGAQQPDRVGQSASAAGQISIAIEEGRITGTIRSYPLEAVLEELSSRTGVALVPADDMDLGTARVSAELRGVPLDQGLRQLLKNYDVFFYYGAVGNASSALRSVWIYPKGTAAALRPVPPEAWASTKDLQAGLTDSDPTVRARAYEALMSRPDRESRELAMQALRGTEPDEMVRERILSSAFSTGGQLPPDVLMYLTRSDSSERIRLIALDALASEPTAKEAARAALNDPSELVRNRAKEILAELEQR